MSDTLQTPIWRRLRFTPLRDLVRGKVTGRLDVTSLIASADLPSPAKSLVQRVVKRTRLWRTEKTAVANELIAHFLDGLEAGQPVEELIRTFGDEKQSAKLICRAKVRNRSWLWHGFKWVRRLFVAMVVFYLLAAIPFFLQSPSPSVDYVAQLNESVLKTPESDRAWPIYRQAILSMMDTPANEGNHGPWSRSAQDKGFPLWLGEPLDGTYWSEMVPWLRQHAADLELLRQGSTKTSFGFVLGPYGSINDEALFPGMGQRSKESWQREPTLIAVLLPYLNHVRALAQALRADAKLAMLDHDGVRVERDIRAMIGIGRQLTADRTFLVTQLVGIGIDALGMVPIERVLRMDPALLSDPQWIGLAHELASVKTASDIMTYRGERMNFHDVTQRVYTDDGNGDGHLTAKGLMFMRQMSGPKAAGTERVMNEDGLLMATGPALMLFGASRKQLLEMTDQIMDTSEANLRRPVREYDPASPDREFNQRLASPVMQVRYLLARLLLPSLQRTAMTADRLLAQREGLTVAIALELYHRKNGQYPATLNELAPIYLPAVPADRITGDPLKYRLIDGKPVVYSVGVDRIDDGGQPAMSGDGPYYDGAAKWISQGEGLPKDAKGDWVLFPRPPITQSED